MAGFVTLMSDQQLAVVRQRDLPALCKTSGSLRHAGELTAINMGYLQPLNTINMCLQTGQIRSGSDSRYLEESVIRNQKHDKRFRT